MLADEDSWRLLYRYRTNRPCVDAGVHIERVTRGQQGLAHVRMRYTRILDGEVSILKDLQVRA
jgi:hypothetical protein